MPAPAPSRRVAPRAAVRCPLTLARAKGGNAVSGHSLDLGPGGMRVSTDRPLRIDEVLAFDLDVHERARVVGQARVLREDGYGTYALRFERVPPSTAEALAQVLARAG